MMSMGVWSMHFIGMLALSLPVPVNYEIGQTFLSYFPALIGAAFALNTISKREVSKQSSHCKWHYYGNRYLCDALCRYGCDDC